jgi:AcrR family transcriptional regulator
MRVSAATKAATRDRILKAARKLLGEVGFDAMTTRDVAQAAGIATGTLFNYFATKEAVVAALVGDAAGDAIAKFDEAATGAPSLEEDLFALITAGLRQLKPLRKHLPSLLETSLSPLVDSSGEDPAALRVAHLERVAAMAAKHGFGELSSVALQLYWTLYTGVLIFWASDKSPRQEDTLALLDHSLVMFVGWLRDHVTSRPATGTP